MGVIKKAWGWCARKARGWHDMISGDDLQDAQVHRGDDHEFKPNAGLNLPMGGGG